MFPNQFDYQLVADDRVQLVSVATPPATRRQIVIGALAAGKAVLCEKPLAVTADEAEELAAAARIAAVPTLVDFEFRGVPAFVQAAELLAESVLGQVESAEVSWTLAHHRRPPGPVWKDNRSLGGGTLLSLGVHSFDYLEWLLAPVARVSGTVSNPPGAAADTGCDAELQLESAATAHVMLSSASEDPQGHVITIRGERGTLRLENRDLGDYMRAFRLELSGERGGRRSSPRKRTRTAAWRRSPPLRGASSTPSPLMEPRYHRSRRADARNASWKHSRPPTEPARRWRSHNDAAADPVAPRGLRVRVARGGRAGGRAAGAARS